MLINSVVLFLRDALPLLLFISILSAIIYLQTNSLRWLVKAIIFGVLGTVALSAFIDRVSEGFDGFGFELLTATIHIFAYISVLLFLRSSSIVLATIAVSLLLSVHGTNLYIYSSGFWSSGGVNVNNALLIGSTLGFGISFSLALLLYYGLSASMMERWSKLPMVVLALTAARQVTEAVYFLIQADWLPTFVVAI
jgi:high-affinity iron transporter